MEAVRTDGNALKYASKDLRSDRNFVLEAVSHDVNVLQYASKTLQADPELQQSIQGPYELKDWLELIN